MEILRIDSQIFWYENGRITNFVYIVRPLVSFTEMGSFATLRPFCEEHNSDENATRGRL